MKIETIIQFIETYINRRRIKRITKRLEKLPYWISKAHFAEHQKVQLEKTFKLIVLQLFKPKSKKQRREFLNGK
jgi:hypothetical protein